MKKNSIVLITLVVFLIIHISIPIFAYTSIFTSGDRLTIDERDLTIQLSGSKENFRVTVFDNIVPANTRRFSVGECLESQYHTICFIETKDCAFNGLDYTCHYCTTNGCEEKEENINPNQEPLNMVNVEILEKTDSMSLEIEASKEDSTFLHEFNRITIRAQKNGTIDTAQLTTFIPHEYPIRNVQHCTLTENTEGVILSFNTDTAQDFFCSFDITATTLEPLELAPTLRYTIGQREFIVTESKNIQFETPYDMTVITSTIDENGTLYIDAKIENKADRTIQFDHIYFHIPQQLETQRQKQLSSFGNDWYILSAEFSLRRNESRKFNFSFRARPIANYTIFVEQKYTYEGNTVIQPFFESFDIDHVRIENQTEPGVSCEDTNEHLEIIHNLEQESILSSTPLQFSVRIQNKAELPLQNIQTNITKNEKIIVQRRLTDIEPQHLRKISDVFQIAPIVLEEQNIEYKINIQYTCDQTIYNISETIMLVVIPMADVEITRTMPSQIREGEEVEISVAIRNTEDWILENARISEIIPDAFDVIGITQRTMTLPRNTQIQAYTYRVRLRDLSQKDFEFTTIVNASYGDATLSATESSLISLEGSSFLDIALEEISGNIGEPTSIFLSITNTVAFPLENIGIRINNNNSMLINRQKIEIPFLSPGQTLRYTIPVIFKNNNPVSITANYYNFSKNTSRTPQLEPQRTNTKLFEYIITKNIYETHTEYNYTILNITEPVFFAFNGQAKEITPQEPYFIANQSGNLSITVLGIAYNKPPQNIIENIMIIETAEEQNQTEEQYNETAQQQQLFLDDAQQSESNIGFILINISALLLVVGGGIGYIVFKRKKKHFNQKTNISKKHFKKIKFRKVKI